MASGCSSYGGGLEKERGPAWVLGCPVRGTLEQVGEAARFPMGSLAVFQQPHLLQFDQFLFFRRLLHRRILLQVLLQSLQLGHCVIYDQLPVGFIFFLFLLLWFL